MLVHNRCPGLRLEAAAVRRLVHALDASRHFHAPFGELSIAVLDGPAMGALHAEFLDDPSPTDVITFDGDPLLQAAGEICVCADVARDYARTHRKDFAAELALYIVHGYLHLAGFDDTTPSTRRLMRRAEREAQAVLAAVHAVLPAAFCGRDSRNSRIAR